MKAIVVITLLIFIYGSSFGQLELLFTQHSLPSEINCLDDGCDIEFGKIPKIIRKKIITSKDTTIETIKYNREGKFIGWDNGTPNFEFEDYNTKINKDTISIFKKTEVNSKLDWKIVLEKKGDTIKKDLIHPDIFLFTSQMYDSKTKKTIYFSVPSWVDINMRYDGDSTFIYYKSYHIIHQELNIRWYESNNVLHIDYFDSLNRIYKNEQYYKIADDYIPKSLCNIDSANNFNYIFQNPIISNNNCDSILFNHYDRNVQFKQWIVIQKNKNGEIISKKYVASDYIGGEILENKYYKCGKRRGDLKERKIIRDDVIIVKIKIKYYLFTKNPIDRWLKKNN